MAEVSMKSNRTRTLFLAALFAAAAGFAGVIFPGCLSRASILESGLAPGTYEGSGRGYRGQIHVRVQLSMAGIEDIEIISHRESAFPGAAAMEELIDSILETGSTDLDAVSGATYSSRGFLEALDDALGKARKSR
jgi:uncharacterized protein with FMN-binding domain